MVEQIILKNNHIKTENVDIFQIMRVLENDTRSNFVFAIGQIREYDGGINKIWHSVVIAPEENDIKFVFNERDDFSFSSLNVFEPEKNGIIMPEVKELYATYVVFEYTSLCLKDNVLNLPQKFSLWNNAFKDFGHVLYKPFLLKKNDLAILGWFAKIAFEENPVITNEYKEDEVFNLKRDSWERRYNSIQNYFLRIYLKKYFEKYNLKGMTIVHAQGNFQGRSGCNSWNKGLRDQQETLISSEKDLHNLGYIGCRVLKIIS